MFKKLLWLSVTTLALAAQENAPPAPRRIALVIGNSNYASLPKLPAVKQSTAVIEAALRGAGFQIFPVDDFRLPEFLSKEREFAATLKTGDICFVYYTGYAVQGESDNFFLPVNFDPKAKGDLEGRAYHFKRLQERLDEHGVALRMFVLDAPPQIDVVIPEAPEPGLMRPDIADVPETVFATAVFPGRWAPISPAGAPTPYSQAVADAINARGLVLAEVFEKVKEECSAQLPDAVSSVRQQQKFYFHEPEKVVPPTPSLPPPPEWPRPGVLVVNRTDREEYLWIRPGKFQMGCVPSDTRCAAAEKPRHEVTISKGFWMGRNEVQVGSYQRYVAANKSRGARMPAAPLDGIGWKASDRPIANVHWEDAAAYCSWAGGRLPREAEWEMAARGGKDGDTYPMSSEDDSRDKANFDGKKGNDIFDFAAPVRKFDPNPFGLYDLAGNVWEFVSDYYSSNYYTSAPITDPEGPRKGSEHVARGGSYNSDPKEHLRISFRKGFSGSYPNVGFRCVINDTPESRKLLPEPGK
jgi:formylglycine-generating enzyme required for sulfatase activity